MLVFTENLTVWTAKFYLCRAPRRTAHTGVHTQVPVTDTFSSSTIKHFSWTNSSVFTLNCDKLVPNSLQARQSSGNPSLGRVCSRRWIRMFAATIPELGLPTEIPAAGADVKVQRSNSAPPHGGLGANPRKSEAVPVIALLLERRSQSDVRSPELIRASHSPGSSYSALYSVW